MAITCVIAEADPFIASLLLRFAEESGLSGVRAKTGQEIAPLVEQSRPAVLILDPELPGDLRGWEALQALRSREAMGALAVISCSWLPRSEICRLIGEVVWHLQKPDLYYSDFVKALEAAGVTTEDRIGPL